MRQAFIVVDDAARLIGQADTIMRHVTQVIFADDDRIPFLKRAAEHVEDWSSKLDALVGEVVVLPPSALQAS